MIRPAHIQNIDKYIVKLDFTAYIVCEEKKKYHTAIYYPN